MANRRRVCSITLRLELNFHSNERARDIIRVPRVLGGKVCSRSICVMSSQSRPAGPLGVHGSLVRLHFHSTKKKDTGDVKRSSSRSESEFPKRN